MHKNNVLVCTCVYFSFMSVSVCKCKASISQSIFHIAKSQVSQRIILTYVWSEVRTFQVTVCV